jgi:hypothetical protein
MPDSVSSACFKSSYKFLRFLPFLAFKERNYNINLENFGKIYQRSELVNIILAAGL